MFKILVHLNQQEIIDHVLFNVVQRNDNDVFTVVFQVIQANIFSDQAIRARFLNRKNFIINYSMIIHENIEFGLILLELISEYEKKTALNVLVNLIRITFKNGEDKKLDQILKFTLTNKNFGDKEFVDKEMKKLIKLNNNKNVLMTLALYYNDSTFDIFLYVNFDYFY